MSFSPISNWDKPINQKRTFLCDLRTDVANLPTQNTASTDYPNGVPAGSDALCAEDGSIWVLKNSGTWAEL